MKKKIVLTIAGSDSGGGAGIQADIKTMTVNGVFAAGVITALTAQNTLGITAVMEVSPDFLAKELDAVLEDLPPNAVKIGMVSSNKLIDVIAEKAHPAIWRPCRSRNYRASRRTRSPSCSPGRRPEAPACRI